MRRLVALGVALLVVTAPTSSAAGKDKAIISGRVLLGDTNRPASDTRVTVLGARLDGQGEVVRKTVAPDEDGRFSFAVPDRGGLEFALEAEYDGGLFVGDSFQIESSSVRSNLRVWETTSDPSVITVLRDHMFVAHDADGAGVLESVTVRNDSQQAYIGRGRALGADASGPSPTLGFALPTASLGQRVDLIDSSLNRLYAADADFGFAATVAIPPGETDVIFAYPARGTAGSYDLTRRALYPTEELSVFVTDPLEVEAARLSYEGEQDVRGEPYREWTTRNGSDAGDVISLLVVAEGNSSSDLWVGLGLGLGAIVLLTAAGVWLRSRPSRLRRQDTPAAVATDEDGDGDLVAAIAALDLERESGGLTEEQWSGRRDELKKKLVEQKQRQGTP